MDAQPNLPHFGLPPRYTERHTPRLDNHNGLAATGVTFQPEVYQLATLLARGAGARCLIDIGCGHADKLAARHPEFDVIGLDTDENIRWCREQYDFGQWLPVDLEQPQTGILPVETLRRATILCADVIEHLVNPLPLVQTLREWLRFAPYAVLSTPDRILVRGRWHQGPPKNPCHVREWQAYELRAFLEAEGLDAWVGLTRSKSNKTKMHTIVSVVMNPERSAGDPNHR